MGRRRLTLQEKYQKLYEDVVDLRKQQEQWFRERGIDPDSLPDPYVHTKGKTQTEFLKWLIEQGYPYIGRDSNVVNTHLFACKFKPKRKDKHAMWDDNEDVLHGDGLSIEDDGYILQDLPDSYTQMYKITDLYEL